MKIIRKIKYFSAGLFQLAIANVLPIDGSALNYTHVFFKWEQVPGAHDYALAIEDLETTAFVNFYNLDNSKMVDEPFEYFSLDWGGNYEWQVHARDENNEVIHMTPVYSFSINSVPDYFPSNIEIISQDEELSQPGITFMDFESQNCSGAVNEAGKLIWIIQRENYSSSKFVFTQLAPNGNVLGYSPGTGYEIDLDGNIIFQTPANVGVHHDFNKTNQGTYFLVSGMVEDHYCPEECSDYLPDMIPWQGDIFRELNSAGEIIWDWNTFDHIDSTEYNPYYVQVYTGQYEMDWTHSNSVYYDETTNSVFVSIRNLSRIIKIDYSSGHIIWNLGETDFMNEIDFDVDLNFSQQHSVQVLENGNLLFFDNHRYLQPELSRCLEVAYDETDMIAEIAWEHELPVNLFSGSRGECDRLENGNTLITAGRTGNTLEVTPENEVVWHLNVENNNLSVSMYRSERTAGLYPIAFSFTLDYYSGTVTEPFLSVVAGNESMMVNIHGWGWSAGVYTAELANESGSILAAASVPVIPGENAQLNFDLSNIELINSEELTLKVYPQFAMEKAEIMIFHLRLHDSGDVNIDGLVDILDVITVINIILESGYNLFADVNQDGSVNILDVVQIVNTILGGEDE